VFPAETYRERLREREARAARLDALHARIGTVRLALFVLTAVAAWWLLTHDAAVWLLVPVAAFIALAMYHSGVRRDHLRAKRAAEFYRHGLARIEDRWVGTGQTGERFDDPHHVYASDLDLFGRDSLFELLFTGRTRMGEETLAQWLLAPATLDEVRQRQASVAELRKLTDLREEIALLGEEAGVGVQPKALIDWAESPNLLTQPWLLLSAFVLPVLAVAGVVIWSVAGFVSPFVVVLVIEAAILRLLFKQLQRVIATTEQAFEDLKLLAGLVERIERERFEAPQLRALCQRLRSHDVPAATAIAKLATVVQLVESRRNPLLQVLEVPLMYSVHVARAAERWRHAHGRAVRDWLRVIGEVEALLSLAAYSYEHPADPLPQFTEGSAKLVGVSLGHPLIPAARCVRNDVRIELPTRGLLVSGSNMSGKSTLLRTVGVNTVLAMAGAPVRAQHMELTPLHVGASIRINDSLHEGSSRFYAEITRLRELHRLSGEAPPLLFLLDELLQGTNSKDRRIGAEGVVRALLGRGAIGFISTHDLALTDIDAASGDRLRNVHFQDELVDGRMTFDFRLRDGVVTRSNGIELMRSIGLEV